jgi:DMSO reductase anchor subunit
VRLLQPLHEWRLRQQAANAGKRATDPESFLTSVGLGVPDRLRVPPEHAQSELYVAEATASSLKIQVTSTTRDLVLQPSTFFLWLLKILLYGFEVGTIAYIFIQELGYPIFTAVTTAVLYTTGTFYLIKNLYHNLCKPRSEWDWHTPILFGIFLITGASLIVLRLANRSTESASLPIDIASALILAFVTLLPGWPAAKYGTQLTTARELKETVATLTVEYQEVRLRVAGLREGIDATSPEDFRLIDRREQLRAILLQRQPQLTDRRSDT